MNLADLFLRELEKDKGVSDVVRKMGQMLAEQHKSALETTAYFAQRQCEIYRLMDKSSQPASLNRMPNCGCKVGEPCHNAACPHMPVVTC